MEIIVFILMLLVGLYILYSLKLKAKIFVGTISKRMVDALDEAKYEGYQIFFSDYFLSFKSKPVSLAESEKKSFKAFVRRALLFKKIVLVTNNTDFFKYAWVNSIFFNLFVYDKRVDRQVNIKWIEQIGKEIIDKYVPPHLTRDYDAHSGKQISRLEKRRVMYLIKLASFPDEMFLENKK